MAKAIAHLKRNKGAYRTDMDGFAPVYIRYSHKSKTILFPTNVKIHPQYWKGDPDQPLKRGLNGYLSANKAILKVKEQVNEIKDNLTSMRLDPTIKLVKETYESSKNPVSETFFGMFEEFIKHSESRVSHGTIGAYKACLLRLKECCKVERISLSLDNINLKFYDSFVRYLFTLGLFNNTVGKHIKNLKVFLNYLKKRGYGINDDISQFKTLKEKPCIVFLTQEELELLYKFDFSQNKRLERVRDLFVLGCSTGLRISDLKRLGPEHIEGDIIKMTAFKNRNKVFVPVIPRSSEILEKYSFKVPKLADQKVNLYIKEACDLAGIHSIVENITNKAGNKVITKVPKWTLVSSHTAVKTFITHCCQNGISPKVVAQITGKSVKVILDHYYGIDEATIEREMYRAFGKPADTTYREIQNIIFLPKSSLK